jgi:hypothetical protein
MLARGLLWSLLGFLAMGQSGPDAGEQQKIIARMREAANSYSDRLQDFLCVQTMTRSLDASGKGQHWKVLETQEIELGYVGHQEHYRLVKVNGKASDLEKRVKKGYFTPKGEFGSALRWIFDPKAQASFEWDGVEDSGGVRVCVFRYQVAKETTTVIMQADRNRVPLGHHGVVAADCETGAVMRFQMESEIGAVQRHGHDLAVGSKLEARYGSVAIGDREFLLPQSAVEVAVFGQSLTKAEIAFGHYRKYDTSSIIKFDDGEIKPDVPVKR